MSVLQFPPSKAKTVNDRSDDFRITENLSVRYLEFRGLTGSQCGRVDWFQSDLKSRGLYYRLVAGGKDFRLCMVAEDHADALIASVSQEVSH